MKQPSVYIIILNYNHRADLEETVSSFLLQDYQEKQIIVSDNGSADDSVTWLRTIHPEITVLENGENLGWAKGNNVGIRYAIGKGAKYILLANNDLGFSDPTILSRLMGSISGYMNRIIGPVQNYYYSPEKTFSCGHYFMNIKEPPFNRIRHNYCREADMSNGIEIVDYAAGSFVLFHAGLIDRVGFIDEAFYLYGEDADFFLRAWKQGYISMIDKGAVILHKISATSGTSSPLKRYYQSRNIWLNLRKHADISDNMAFFRILALKGITRNLIADLFHFRFHLLRATIKGLWHGLVAKKYGKEASF